MTIERKFMDSPLNVAKSYCDTCSRHLFVIHTGYEDDSPLLAKAELDELEAVTQRHEVQFKGQHNIRVLVWQRKT